MPARRRRGFSILAVVALILLLELMVAGMVMGTGRDHDLTLRRVETVRAFYACEAGANMALRELIENADADGDGAVGSISDDGNAANDPDLGAGARFSVTVAERAGRTTVTSEGRAGSARRTVEVVLE